MRGSNRNLTLLSEILESSVGRPEVLRAGRAQRVMRFWPEVVGEMLASVCVPDRYDRGVIWVAATGNAWALEVRFQKVEILRRLNEFAGEQLFEDLRVGTRVPRRDWLEPL